ncbi:MAG: monovalent cation/H+ antiporter subunit D family protein [Sulfuricaulis sp.]|uniref:monovalent cation/H+ antiporter subunit D family protein n=1 Tax=Sulfuricaulis sp. TaxID=2003553 RepID=UPI0034A2A39A
MIGDNLPVLIVVVPLLAALVIPLVRKGNVAWFVAMTACIAVFAGAIALLVRVSDHGPISYALGNWPPPIGIEYRVDRLNSFVLLIVSGISVVVTLFARLSVAKEIPADRIHFFYSAYLMCITGLLGITITGDAFNLYVLLEISSLATYTLVAMGTQPHALRASFNYLVLGTIGATFLLIGIGHLYMATGTLNMLDLQQRLPDLMESRTVRSGFAFIIVGASLKLALFPLHLWLPNAYTHAPSSVTALLAATATKVGAYILLRFLFTIFGIEFSFGTLQADKVLLLAASVAVITGSVIAIRQDNIKRMLAYSSIAQIGYIALGIGLASVTGVTAGILHLFNHALMKGALFLAIGCVAYRAGLVNIDSIAGLGRRMPWTFAAFTAAGLSLIGIPLTTGFISKWYLVLAAFEKGWWPIAVLVLIGSLLALVYVWRVVESAYFRPLLKSGRNIKEAPFQMLVPTWILVLANIYFGINTELTVGAANESAIMLLGAITGNP